MPEQYKVRVTKDHLVFCSGHFISYEGDKCERLHGHNYRMAVEVEGPLDSNRYVFDFIALKDAALAIVNELDHRMLVPTGNPHIHTDISDEAVRMEYRGRDQGPCLLSRARVAVSARRLRVAAHREYHGGAAGPLHRPTVVGGSPQAAPL